jgi:hypothetical protein
LAPVEAAVADVDASPGTIFRKSEPPGVTAFALSACSKSQPVLPRGVRTLIHFSSLRSTSTCSPFRTVSTTSWNDALPARTSALVRSTHRVVGWPAATAATSNPQPVARTNRAFM